MAKKSSSKSSSSSSYSNSVDSSSAKEKMDQLKYEVAKEVGVPLKEGYNGDLTSAQNGKVGGNMVKKMIEDQISKM